MKPGALIASLAAVTFLGGCQSFLGTFFSKSSSDPSAVTENAGAEFFTDAGRTALEAGAYGAAIEEFSRALAYGENRAVAVNGLGVAYAKIGRADLAHRYFSEALTIEPENPRYVANFNRLISSPAFTMQHSGDVGKDLIAQHAASVDAADPDVGPDQQTGRLVRYGPRDVRITAVEALASVGKLPQVTHAALTSNATSAVAGPRVVFTKPTPTTLSRFKPEVTVNFAEVAPERPRKVRKISSPHHDLRGFKPLVTVAFTSDSDATP